MDCLEHAKGLNRANSPPGAYGRAALEREIADAGCYRTGQPANYALNLCAFRLAQLVAGGELERRKLNGLLNRACAIKLIANDRWLAESSEKHRQRLWRRPATLHARAGAA